MKRPVPIYITYYTAETLANESLVFFIDIYGRDEKMIKILYKN
jgi:murein L,D-transpeptidase YcbB/YkuD